MQVMKRRRRGALAFSADESLECVMASMMHHDIIHDDDSLVFESSTNSGRFPKRRRNSDRDDAALEEVDSHKSLECCISKHSLEKCDPTCLPGCTGPVSKFGDKISYNPCDDFKSLGPNLTQVEMINTESIDLPIFDRLSQNIDHKSRRPELNFGIRKGQSGTEAKH